MAEAKIPVTIVTGFLGAGKSTLLRYIMTEKHGKRIAVINNEFGDTAGMEDAIVLEGADGTVFEECYQLSNGCICCSIKHDLVNTLETIMKARDKFDYVLVETTGLADPGPVASIFWLDEELACDLQLDGIITVADAKHILQQVGRAGVEDVSANEAQKQLAMADRVILNKIDLVADETISEIERTISRCRSVNPLTSIVRARHSVVDLASVLGIGAFSMDRAIKVDELHSATGSERHDLSVRAVVIRHVGEVELAAVERWLGFWLWDDEADKRGGAEVFRTKGVLALRADPSRHFVQGVRELFDTAEGSAWQPNEIRENRICFIGRGLDEDLMLRTFLDSCVKQRP